MNNQENLKDHCLNKKIVHVSDELYRIDYYDENNNLINIECYENDKLKYYNKYHYDNKNNLTKKEYYYDNKLTSYDKYHYDNKNNKIKKNIIMMIN